MKNLVKLQDLFESSVYKVPDYQRGYSWEYIHRRDLIEDLESLDYIGLKYKHYTGTLVLQFHREVEGFGERLTEYHIVDGQQRITSLLILLRIIINELESIEDDLAKNTAKKLKKRYISDDGPQGSIIRLHLDEINDGFFIESIINFIQDVERKTQSHENINNAKKQFSEYLNQIKDKKSSDKEYLKSLSELADKITQQLVFTVYEVEDDAEVGVIFEVMNDRGKPLSDLEKVKNYILYLTDRISNEKVSKKQLVDKINNTWKEVLENLSKAKLTSIQDENTFLRINYVANYYDEISGYTDQDTGRRVSIEAQLADIHKLVKNHLKEKEKDKKTCYKELEGYISSLKRMSYKFRDIIDPLYTHSFQDIYDSNIKEELQEVLLQFDRLNIKSSVLPLLITIHEKFSNDQEKLLNLTRLCEKFVFRIYYLGGLRSYTARTTIYSVSNEIYKGKIDAVKLEDRLRKIIREYAPDNIIRKNLSLKDFDYYNFDGLNYLLYEYEKERCKETTGKKPQYHWNDLEKLEKEESIEHILPQNPKDKGYWTDKFLTKESREMNVKRLGNLTLTEKNSSLGAKSFSEKKLIYKNSRWQIERDLLDFDDWTEKEINQREEQLIKFAEERWKI